MHSRALRRLTHCLSDKKFISTAKNQSLDDLFLLSLGKNFFETFDGAVYRGLANLHLL